MRGGERCVCMLVWVTNCHFVACVHMSKMYWLRCQTFPAPKSPTMIWSAVYVLFSVQQPVKATHFPSRNAYTLKERGPFLCLRCIGHMVLESIFSNTNLYSKGDVVEIMKLSSLSQVLFRSIQFRAAWIENLGIFYKSAPVLNGVQDLSMLTTMLLRSLGICGAISIFL